VSLEKVTRRGTRGSATELPQQVRSQMEFGNEGERNPPSPPPSVRRLPTAATLGRKAELGSGQESAPPKLVAVVEGLGRGGLGGPGRSLVGVEADDGFARFAHVETVAGDVLDIGVVVFHVLGFELELGLFFLGRGDFAFGLGDLGLVAVLLLDDGDEEKADDGKQTDDDGTLDDRDERGPDVAPALPFERNAGGIKKSGAGHTGFCTISESFLTGKHESIKTELLRRAVMEFFQDQL